ncbi:MAG: peptidoglycan editing factor PgeF [Candidatus Competibacteraceae bacterium]|nr:peptidoglycan editing factor PgeF [Candidatus Competibacteraceae bacterium]
MSLEANHLIQPDWPAPATVRAVTTTRLGGISQGRFASLNLGFHTEDDEQAVHHNRQQLYTQLELAQEPAWLRQVHGNQVVDVATITEPVTADASVSRQPGKACVVMTADCLPVLLCDRAGHCVAAAHAGWRGLAAEIIAATVEAMHCPTSEVMAWLGPAIGPDVFEVGDEVRAQFLQLDAANQVCFKPSPAGRWLADIYALARRQLQDLGITAVYGGDWCTVSDPTRFYSYRRDGSSGRMASLIWLQA